MRLGEQLVELGLVSADALNAALETQQLQGGRLGTTLVQQEVLSVEDLGAALGTQQSVAVADESLFQNSRVLARLPAEVAACCYAVPLYESDTALVVAMMDPRDQALLTVIEQAAGRPIHPCVAPELRVHYWLEKHYGIPRPNYLLRSDTGSIPPGLHPRRVIQPAPAPLPDEPRKKLGRIATVKRAVPSAPKLTPAVDDLGLDVTIDVRRRSRAAEQALERIEAAQASRQLADALCDFMAGTVGCGLLLRVREQVAIGWRAAHARDAEVVQTLAVPLDLPTAFRAVCETGATYRGQPPEKGQAWHARLSALMGHEPPRDLLVVPLLAADRVSALIYVHMADGNAIPAQIISDLEALADAVSRRVSARAHE